MQEILGQSRAVTQLQRAIDAGRLAHTWIFAGPPGVGKMTTALALAKTRLCDEPLRQARLDPPSGQPETLSLACGSCESCRSFAAGAHPDLHLITKELIRQHDRTGKSRGTTLGIDVIRGEITGNDKPDGRVESKIYKRSFRGRGKWFLIDEADLMEAPAQNALLKTLEEPPPDSFLVLITTSPAELLTTIRSRAQLVTFQPLSQVLITECLSREGLDPGDAALLARLAQGSLGRGRYWAQRLLSPPSEKLMARGILAWSELLGGQLAEFAAGKIPGSMLVSQLQKLAEEYCTYRLLDDPLTSGDRATRDGLIELLTLCGLWFADAMRLGLGIPSEPAMPGILGPLAPRVTGRLLDFTRQAQVDIDNNAYLPLLLTSLLIQWEAAMKGT